jgi:hypothetical protein
MANQKRLRLPQPSKPFECANQDYRDVLYWAEYPDE